MYSLLIAMLFYSDLKFVKNFEPITDEKQRLTVPMDFCISQSQNLYIVDSDTSFIHRWSEKGKYLGAFAGEGKGPGELIFPTWIESKGDLIYVLDLQTKAISSYTGDGKFLTSRKLAWGQYWAFAPLDDGAILLAATEETEERRLENYFIHMKKDNSTSKIFTLADDNFIKKDTYKAYAGMEEIQKYEKDTYVYGYGDSNTLYVINRQGKPLEQIKVSLPTAPPSNEDIKLFNETHIVFDGKPISTKDKSRWNFTFEKNKSYYTQFLPKGDKILFILTPIGAFYPLPDGHHVGQYRIYSLKSKKIEKQGRFELPEGSYVFVKDHRIITAYLNNDDEYEIKETQIAGF